MAGDDDGNNDASSSTIGSGGSGPRLPSREQQQPAHEAPPAAPTGTGVNAATMAALQVKEKGTRELIDLKLFLRFLALKRHLFPLSLSPKTKKNTQAQLAALASQQRAAARPPPSAGQHQKEKYAFWETQPVAQFGGGGEGGEGGEGEAEAPVRVFGFFSFPFSFFSFRVPSSKKTTDGKKLTNSLSLFFFLLMLSTHTGPHRQAQDAGRRPVRPLSSP